MEASVQVVHRYKILHGIMTTISMTFRYSAEKFACDQMLKLFSYNILAQCIDVHIVQVW